MTDGQNNAGKVAPTTVAEAAKALGVKVYTIGVGKRGESRRPRMDRYGRPLHDFLAERYTTRTRRTSTRMCCRRSPT